MAKQKNRPQAIDILSEFLLNFNLKNTMKLFGMLDIARNNAIDGWAWDPQNPDKLVELELWIDGIKIGDNFIADRFRLDLKERDIGTGHHGFSVDIPLEFLDGEKHEFDIRFNTTGESINYSPSTVRTRRSDESLRISSLFFDHVLIKDGCIGKNLEEALLKNKKLVIFCSFSPNGKHYEYHSYLKKSLIDIGYTILWVTSSPDGVITDETYFNSTDFYIIKKNEGYDFGSWLVGLHKVLPYMESLNELILINDSVFGPLFDLRPFIDKMSHSSCDFWGIVDSYEHTYHLQSFFLFFKRKILKEKALVKFIEQYEFSSDKSVVIQQGELGISKFMISHGYEPGSIHYCRDLSKKWLMRVGKYIEKVKRFDENRLLLQIDDDKVNSRIESIDAIQFLSFVTRNIRLGHPFNPMHFFWDILLEENCLFIKRELLFKNVISHPFHFEIINQLREKTNYPIEYIYECAVKYGTEKVI